MKYKIVKNETFLFYVAIVIGAESLTDLEDLLRRINYLPGDESLPGSNAFASATSFSSTGTDYIICFWESRRHNWSVEEAAHEAVHIAGWVCEQRRINVDSENDEPLAYLTQWVTLKVLETFGVGTLLGEANEK